ncbi:MAG: hypothetical protein AAFR59_13440, partial [Bacteroidota bacterium]
MPKLILSRKGLDSSSGGHPSPIMTDQLISFPIPQTKGGIPYNRIRMPDALSAKKLGTELGMQLPSSCHLDPDLQATSLKKRPDDWKPCFGQHGAALTHLMNHGVGEGDIFLFYGWFKQADKTEGKWQFVKEAPDVHVIYGYLEVGGIISCNTDSEIPSWLSYHPHVTSKTAYGALNKVFVAADRCSLQPERAGAGVLRFDLSRQLTSPLSKTRSLWELPDDFFDDSDHCLLSYHQKRKGKRHPSREKWRLVQNVARGQEFIVERTEKITN